MENMPHTVQSALSAIAHASRHSTWREGPDGTVRFEGCVSHHTFDLALSGEVLATTHDVPTLAILYPLTRNSHWDGCGCVEAVAEGWAGLRALPK